MKKLILTSRQLEDIYFGESERFAIIKEREWEQEHKYQLKQIIFEDTTTGIKYSAYIGRSGSPFTDWTYNSEIMDKNEEVCPVEEKEVVIKKWVYVDDDKITETEKVKSI
ncbi:hypothetical protein [Clostridium thermopalmarium]|uniref:Uncharacterized protein n=1 Tax=Clostridium thermopalmarium DSM 5974 TaxID=1121340 RepID=A0A2T0APR4_9CLOT|nr:hypothetical protein [Clostridium thermopalmarium]PRR70891.1 hypothetical protein CPAL_19810 [Clostridium thermopalmarium DSM 5974]PVZ28815.1 hypothetical protein LX19_00119 [Clostridium thermopalmarium DSM 5974]